MALARSSGTLTDRAADAWAIMADANADEWLVDGTDLHEMWEGGVDLLDKFGQSIAAGEGGDWPARKDAARERVSHEYGPYARERGFTDRMSDVSIQLKGGPWYAALEEERHGSYEAVLRLVGMIDQQIREYEAREPAMM